MAAPKRTAFQRENDYVTITDMYLRGIPQMQIAGKLTVSQQQVSRDLQVIQRRWRESVIIDFNEAKQKELSRIDILEREAWDAFERSRTERSRTKTGKKTGIDGDSTEAHLERENRDGDPRFMDIILKCIAQRSAILGINAAVRLGPADWRDEISKLGADPDAVKRLAIAAIASGTGLLHGGSGTGSTEPN